MPPGQSPPAHIHVLHAHVQQVLIAMLSDAVKVLDNSLFIKSLFRYLSVEPLASFLTRSVFHSELKTWLFTKSFPP